MQEMGLSDLEPSERRAVVRNGFREAVAVIIVATTFGLWVGSVTSVPYIHFNPAQQMVLDGLAYLQMSAAAFLVFGKRTIEEALSLLAKLRGTE